jgi:agmatinase
MLRPRTLQVISSRRTNSSEFVTPRIITLGGDHTTTLPALRSTFAHWGPVSVIHFDSHLGGSGDTRRAAFTPY